MKISRVILLCLFLFSSFLGLFFSDVFFSNFQKRDFILLLGIMKSGPSYFLYITDSLPIVMKTPSTYKRILTVTLNIAFNN